MPDAESTDADPPPAEPSVRFDAVPVRDTTPERGDVLDSCDICMHCILIRKLMVDSASGLSKRPCSDVSPADLPAS